MKPPVLEELGALYAAQAHPQPHPQPKEPLGRVPCAARPHGITQGPRKAADHVMPISLQEYRVREGITLALHHLTHKRRIRWPMLLVAAYWLAFWAVLVWGCYRAS